MEEWGYLFIYLFVATKLNLQVEVTQPFQSDTPVFSLKICKKCIVKTCGHTEFKSIPFLSLKLFKNKLEMIKTKKKFKRIISIILNFGIYVYSLILNTC